jgi:hypothetical protein
VVNSKDGRGPAVVLELEASTGAFAAELVVRWADERVLPLPTELRSLIASGAWPLTEQEANRQNLPTGPIPNALVEDLVPGENLLYLHWPPFRTIAERCATGERDFWEEFGALDQIDPARALLIGDFGLGSDAVIVLDYRHPESPPLIRLAWADGQHRPRWAPFFETFADFARAFEVALARRAPPNFELQLTKAPWR